MSAQLDFARRLPESLGPEISPDECTNKFLEVKDAIIWLVERNGVKTLRTYYSMPKDSKSFRRHEQNSLGARTRQRRPGGVPQKETRN